MDDRDLEQLKPITEHFLQDVQASDSLKNRTLASIARGSRESRPAWRRALVRGSAAALVLAGGLFLFGSGIRDYFTNGGMPHGTDDPGTIEIAPIGSNGLPEHVPQRFALLEQELDPERNGEWRILRYSAPDESLILLRSGEAWPAEDGYAPVAIVPSAGTAEAVSRGSAKQLADGTLDLRWQSKAYFYRLTGTVTLEEALAIAGSLTN